MSEENNDGVTVKRSAETSLDEFGAILREMWDDEIETEDGVVTLADYVDRLGRVKDAIEQERRQLRSLVARFANCHEDNEDFGALLREARFMLTDTPYAVVDGEPVAVLHGRVAEKAGAESRPFVGVDLAKDKPTFVCATIAPGNVAALREALTAFVGYLTQKRIDEVWAKTTLPEPGLDRLVEQARAALSAPARNCDRFATELDAQLAFLNDEWLISVEKETMQKTDKFENWTEQMKTCYGRWLLAPAKKGGAE